MGGAGTSHTPLLLSPNPAPSTAPILPSSLWPWMGEWAQEPGAGAAVQFSLIPERQNFVLTPVGRERVGWPASVGPAASGLQRASRMSSQTRASGTGQVALKLAPLARRGRQLRALAL